MNSDSNEFQTKSIEIEEYFFRAQEKKSMIFIENIHVSN